jgi:hypothetical protein
VVAAVVAVDPAAKLKLMVLATTVGQQQVLAVTAVLAASAAKLQPATQRRMLARSR